MLRSSCSLPLLRNYRGRTNDYLQVSQDYLLFVHSPQNQLPFVLLTGRSLKLPSSQRHVIFNMSYVACALVKQVSRLV